MAQKLITELPLRSNVVDTVNFPSDDTIQSYRVTAAQVKEYILAQVVKFKSAAYTILSSDTLIVANPESGQFALTLPDASTMKRPINVKNNGRFNYVQILPTGGDTILGDANALISPGTSVTFISDQSSNWHAF